MRCCCWIGRWGRGRPPGRRRRTGSAGDWRRAGRRPLVKGEQGYDGQRADCRCAGQGGRVPARGAGRADAGRAGVAAGAGRQFHRVDAVAYGAGGGYVDSVFRPVPAGAVGERGLARAVRAAHAGQRVRAYGGAGERLSAPGFGGVSGVPDGGAGGDAGVSGYAGGG